MAKTNLPQSAKKARSNGTQTRPLGTVLSLTNHQDIDQGAVPRWDVSVRNDVQIAHKILMEVLSHAGLLVAALERLEQDEPEASDCVHAGGAEFAANAIKARILEAANLLDADLGSEGAKIRHALLDVWSMATLAAHALACGSPLYGREGESVICRYPAVAAVRSVMKSADELTDRIDMLCRQNKRLQSRNSCSASDGKTEAAHG